MREGWKKVHLIDLCTEITDGSHYSPKTSSEFEYPYVTVRDLNDGVIDFEGAKKVTESDYSDLLKNGCKPNIGDLLFSKDGTVGKVALVDTAVDFVVLSSLAILRTNQDLLIPSFLKYLLQSPKILEEATGRKTGVAIRRIILKHLKSIEVFYPESKSEQQRIVEILDEAFEAIDQAKANVERNIQNAEELFQSKLNEVFSQRGEGWEEKKLGELGRVSMCKRIYKKETSTTGQIPFFKIGTFGKDPDAFISEELYKAYKEKYHYPNEGDILLSASGTIGRRVIYDGQPAYFQDSNIVWISNNEEYVTNPFLYHFYSVCDWNASKGATISRLYNDDLRKIRITYPIDKLEQERLVKVFEQMSEGSGTIKTVLKSKLFKLEELKKSILQKAFSGELTVNEEVAA